MERQVELGGYAEADTGAAAGRDQGLDDEFPALSGVVDAGPENDARPVAAAASTVLIRASLLNKVAPLARRAGSSHGRPCRCRHANTPTATKASSLSTALGSQP